MIEGPILHHDDDDVLDAGFCRVSCRGRQGRDLRRDVADITASHARERERREASQSDQSRFHAEKRGSYFFARQGRPPEFIPSAQALSRQQLHEDQLDVTPWERRQRLDVLGVGVTRPSARESPSAEGVR
jgi:hypothetical protein